MAPPPVPGSRYAALAPEMTAPAHARLADAMPSSGAMRAMARGRNAQSRRWRQPRILVVTSVIAARAATKELRRHAMIGVDLEGVMLSRTGSIELVQASCPGHVYLFDVAGPLAVEMFDKGGLRDLLERPMTIKVVHDCRHDADALWHQHSVRIHPVVDTQVAFAELRAARGRARGLPVGLRTVLRKFAAVSEDDAALKATVKGEMRARPDYWAQRPLTKEMIDYASFDVMHLVRALNAMKRCMDAIVTTAWKRVEAGSAEYAAMFRDDPDGRGPEKAARMYDDMARTAARERIAFELQRTKELMVKQDPLRNFVLNQSQVISAVLGLSIDDAQAAGLISLEEPEKSKTRNGGSTIRIRVNTAQKRTEEVQADPEVQCKKLSDAIIKAYEVESSKALSGAN